jgi:hypothetical protein
MDVLTTFGLFGVLFTTAVPGLHHAIDLAVELHRHLSVVFADGGRLTLGYTLLKIGATVAAKIGSSRLKSGMLASR